MRASHGELLEMTFAWTFSRQVPGLENMEFLLVQGAASGQRSQSALHVPSNRGMTFLEPFHRKDGWI
jgi:hypothetical protein